MFEGWELRGRRCDSSAAFRERDPDLPPHKSGHERWL